MQCAFLCHAAQARVEARARELAELDEAIERVKRQASEKGEELGGQQPLSKIRAALKSLRAAAKALHLREALTQQQLASKRAAQQARKDAAETARRKKSKATSRREAENEEPALPDLA